jgi:hypothetical protein
MQTARGKLQAATVISKTTQTLIGQEIRCSGYDYITLFFDYVKGDETGVIVQAHAMQESGGTAYQDQSWTATAGTKSSTANEYTATASGSHYVTFDIRGIEFIKFTQGGSNNDGTPTGTLAASYTLKKG